MYRLEFKSRRRSKKKIVMLKEIQKRKHVESAEQSVEYIVRSLRAIWNCLNRIYCSATQNSTYLTFDTWAECDVVVVTVVFFSLSFFSSHFKINVFDSTSLFDLISDIFKIFKFNLINNKKKLRKNFNYGIWKSC